MAPGWLDRDEKILEPERNRSEAGGSMEVNAQSQPVSIMDRQIGDQEEMGTIEAPQTGEGDELDRAFGGMVLRSEQHQGR